MRVVLLHRRTRRRVSIVQIDEGRPYKLLLNTVTMYIHTYLRCSEIDAPSGAFLPSLQSAANKGVLDNTKSCVPGIAVWRMLSAVSK
jgi:hypothetical protein